MTDPRNNPPADARDFGKTPYDRGRIYAARMHLHEAQNIIALTVGNYCKRGDDDVHMIRYELLKASIRRAVECLRPEEET